MAVAGVQQVTEMLRTGALHLAPGTILDQRGPWTP
ncbi:hypothetical protein BH23GEM11_BH23GEM11_05440 [soil metagenome]